MDETIDYQLLYTNKANEILNILSGLRQCDVKNVMELINTKLPTVAVIQFHLS